MLIVHVGAPFWVGDHADVRINGVPATLHWRDEHTLVINDTHPRQILFFERGGVDGIGRPIVSFTCGDAETAL